MTDTNKMRKLLAAATPLPWIVQKDDYWNWNSWSVTGPAPERVPGWQTREPKAFDDGSAQGNYPATCTDATRDLIVAAINGLPAMLDELDAARAEVERAKRALLAGGYTDHGGQDWKPPIGPSAARLLAELDDVRKENERLRGVRRRKAIRAELESRLAACDAIRADLREAMELLQAHGEPPNWLRQAWLRREPGDDTTAFHTWNRRYGKLLAKHKETP